MASSGVSRSFWDLCLAARQMSPLVTVLGNERISLTSSPREGEPDQMDARAELATIGSMISSLCWLPAMLSTSRCSATVVKSTFAEVFQNKVPLTFDMSRWLKDQLRPDSGKLMTQYSTYQ